jgi:Xaa-Pro aminopeptidase
MREEVVEKVRGVMEETDLERLVVTKKPNLEYLTGIKDLSGVLLLEQGTYRLVTSKFFRYSVQGWSNASVYVTPEEREELVEELALQDGDAADRVEIGEDVELEQTDIIAQARLTKTGREIEVMRKACSIGSSSFEHILHSFEPGMTEFELVKVADGVMRDHGVHNAFETLAHTDTTEPHRMSDTRTVEEGRTLLVDLGCRYNMYCSDMTRMVPNSYVGEAKQLVDDIGAIQQEALERVAAGADAGEIARAAEDAAADKGYEIDEHYLHSLGHGVGVEVHEGPTLHSSSESVLEEGMVVTVEPGLYVPGVGGVRIEDQVVVREDGYERLTKQPRIYDR